MAKFRITTKQMKNSNGVRIEPGMTVNGGQAVADAFMRIYGIDIKKAGALNMTYLDVERLG